MVAGDTNHKLPNHIAIIMDGNGRWARKQNMPRIYGHQAGRKTVLKIVEHCARIKIKSLTLFAFSTENWNRPREEVSKLMDLFLFTLKKEAHKLNNNNIRLAIIGDISCFSARLKQEIAKSMELTSANNGMYLNIAANYGGKWDIVEAVNKSLQTGVKTISADDINKNICLAGQSIPDLFIRTGGERRISNFLLWQLAYTELYFTDTYWPDFCPDHIDRAIDYYFRRERRFGLTGEQVQNHQDN